MLGKMYKKTGKYFDFFKKTQVFKYTYLIICLIGVMAHKFSLKGIIRQWDKTVKQSLSTDGWVLRVDEWYGESSIFVLFSKDL